MAMDATVPLGPVLVFCPRRNMYPRWTDLDRNVYENYDGVAL